MAGKKDFLDEDEDMATDWPMIDSYATEEGVRVKIFKAAHCVAGINKYSARPRKAVSIL